MTMRIVALIGCGAGCLLAAAIEPRQKVQVTKTERIDFPAGGALRLANSIGVLTVEAWDRPDVEITTIKSTKVESDAHQRQEAAPGIGPSLPLIFWMLLLKKPSSIWNTASRRQPLPGSLPIMTLGR
jgi:hypothetical protein